MLNVDLSMLVTVLYVIILYLFLSRFFFRPVADIIHRRRELTEGRLEDARKRIEAVEHKTSEYEHAIRDARGEAYKYQEAQRERALAEKAALVAKTKTETESVVREGRARLAAEAEAARQRMTSDVDLLAKELTSTILRD